ALNPKDTRVTVNPPSPPTEETIDASEVTENDVKAVNPATGETMVLKDGKWVKVKKNS
ncbi:hypothetical protein LCGC14_2744530, partial [marine sediment metagenome]